MRRMESDARGAPPFRVLGDTGGHVYVVAPPPPTLAPEPYKIATSTSSNNRARRRSSFVIIAEARPATPTSRSPSPSPVTGRVSPFRGRGFKGPPPRAQSRPQTPEAKETRRVGRIDRRMSTSQQNSPKRSLIPQPARRRSVSLSKTTEGGKGSPKYGRRATSKNHLEVAPVAPGRRASLKVPGLSPIQGTPTKPQDKKPGHNPLPKKSSPLKSTRRNSTLPPPKGGGRPNPILKTKPPTKPTNSKTQEQPTSPSKIPVKKGSVPDLKGTLVSRQNSRRGSLAKISTPKNAEKSEKPSREKQEQKNQKDQKDSRSANGNNSESSGQQQNAPKKTDPQPKAQPTSSKEVGEDVVEGKEPQVPSKDELSLMELLKQSSGASGTSSVVNTTTVTAAQPLQIDAVALVDSEIHKIMEKEAEVKRRNPDSGRRNGAARPTAINVSPSNSDSYFPPKQEDGLNEAKTSEGNSSEGKNRNQKTGSGTQGSVRSTVASAKSSASNAERLNMNSSGVKTVSNETSQQTMSPDSINRLVTNGQGLQPAEGGQPRSSADANHRAREMGKEKDTTVVDSSKPPDVQSMSMKGSSGGGDDRATPKSTARSVMDERMVTPVNLVASSDAIHIQSAVVNNVKHPQLDDQHMGSAASLKSTAGLSTGSTDTGVSVNTVRGVSSAREKRGMHMVKQPQGIETLSGNVVHLEQNGEPVVPGARPSDHQGEDRERSGGSADAEKSRWKRILDRCCGCCKCKCNCCDHGRAMRCLACRRGLKPQMNRPQPMNQESHKEQTGCLSKLKSSRCCRLPNWKGCARGSRVAPAEENGCCPPERRCGSIFRKFCSRCICKRQDGPSQIRNVQAKQSLTSIAAPVLPEEPKSKLPEVLVEHNAPMRGAIPCLPIPLAWFCLVWNVLIPGTGTFWSGLFNLCVGQPRFSAVATPRARVGAFFVNTVVGVGQMFTVLFCLVGWGWSIWWGVMMVRLARKYKRFRDSETANNDVEARGGGEASTVPPGVPSQALRGYERAR